MMKSVQYLNQLIGKEVDEEGIKSDRVVVGGFSQGSIISLLCGLTSERKLAGVGVLSGYLPCFRTIGSVSNHIFYRSLSY
jgi:lysophospholipase I